MIDVITASVTVLATMAKIAVPSVNQLRAPPLVMSDAPGLLDHARRAAAKGTETVRPPLQVPRLLYGPLLYVPGTEGITYTPAQSEIIHRLGMSPARIEPPAGHAKAAPPPKAPPLPRVPPLPTALPTPVVPAPHPKELPGLAKWTGLVDVMAIMPRPTAITNTPAAHASDRKTRAHTVGDKVHCPICAVQITQTGSGKRKDRRYFYKHMEVHMGNGEYMCDEFWTAENRFQCKKCNTTHQHSKKKLLNHPSICPASVRLLPPTARPDPAADTTPDVPLPTAPGGLPSLAEVCSCSVDTMKKLPNKVMPHWTRSLPA